MIDCPLCKDVLETGHEALEHCKSAHPEPSISEGILVLMSLIEVNRMAATKPAIEIKPLPGTTVSMDIKEPYSLGVLYAVLAIMVVGTFIMVLLHRNGVI